ncbi:MAG: hypothetical protein EP312_03640 [Gammaproteobacteria bacterium]|nr:MAG: hypothetical protein EP312_03640 [Gammaproteobacteria bacterium]
MRYVFMSLMLVMLSACGTVAEEPDVAMQGLLDAAKQQSSASGDCFYIHTVDSYRVVDAQHLLVYAPSRSKPWLLELSNACPLLRDGDALLLEGSSGRICGAAGDAVRSRTQNCGIKAVYAITPEIADGLKAAKKEQ